MASTLISGLGVFTIGFLTFIIILLLSPLLPGIDGPYYALQVMWILRFGWLKYMDPPVTFYLMALATGLIGDVFIGIKFIVSIFTALATLSIYMFFRRFSVSSIAGLAAATVFVYNPFIYRLIGDFMKNAVALFFLLFGLYYLVAWNGGHHRNLIIVWIMFVLCGLTHILVFGVFVLYILFFSITLFLVGEVRRSIYLLTPLLLVFIVFVLAPFLTGGDIWKAFNILNKIFYGATFSPPPRVEWLLLGYGAAFASLLVGYGFYRGGETRYSSFFLINGIVCLLINFPLIPRNILFRTQLMTVVPLAFTVGGVASSPRLRVRELGGIIFIVILILSLSVHSMYGVRPSIPVGEYNELKSFIGSVDGDVGYVVPDVRLKYWVETLSDDVARRFDPTLLKNYDHLYLVTDFRSRFIPKKVRLVYEGVFIRVYEFGPPFSP